MITESKAPPIGLIKAKRLMREERDLKKLYEKNKSMMRNVIFQKN